MTKTTQPVTPGQPVLVRRDISQIPLNAAVPGAHSRNSGRRTLRVRARITPRRLLQLFLLMVGLCGTGYYLYTLSDRFIYQKYENWAFDQQISGRKGVTFTEYVRERTPFGFLVGEKAEVAPVAPTPESNAAVQPATGTLLGRVTIGRLNLAAIVREGVDDQTLSTAVGHVPTTALPGEPGNFAIAAHRDTLFRALKDIKRDDVISFQSASGTYTYQVAATEIVKPSDVRVLRPDGGGLVSNPERLLTMITCYPFYYVGAAPKRFIVQARLISEQAATRRQPVAVVDSPVYDVVPKRPHKRSRYSLRDAKQ